MLVTFTVPSEVRKRLKLDDSVSVEGVCLTVIKLGTHSFTSEVIPETLKRTSLKNLQEGEYLNLELLSGLHTRLKVLAAMRQTTMSALLDEALQDLMEKHGVEIET